jgi:RHS repeat-associated protein
MGEGCSYNYDRYGNRWNQNQYSGTCPTPMYTFTGNGTTNNNRIDGWSYDAAGNVLNDGFHSYAYDAENRISSVDSGATTYTYDADGRRVSKTVGGALTNYIYDREGHIILTNPAAPSLIETYAAGLHLGTYILNTTHTDTIFFYDHADWLGTERARTNLSGSACEKISSLAFGDNQSIVNTCGTNPAQSDISPMHFTGKMRDPESNLDYFGARYYSSTQGRFMSPDWAARPIAVPYAVFGDPQSLNLYGYVRNDPVTRADADGHVAGADDLVEAAVVGLTIGIVATQVYYAMPPEQRNFGASLSAAASSVGGTIKSWFQSSDNGKTAPATPAPTTPAPATTPTSGQQVPTQAPGFVGDAGGNVVQIPAGSTARPADNGNGVVYQPPVPAGAHPDANAVRVMGPTAAQPTGSITVHGPTGQPINPATGKPDTRANTHTPTVPVAPKPCPSGGSGCSQ